MGSHWELAHSWRLFAGLNGDFLVMHEVRTPNGGGTLSNPLLMILTVDRDLKSGLYIGGGLGASPRAQSGNGTGRYSPEVHIGYSRR
jgi:hypothetical protein